MHSDSRKTVAVLAVHVKPAKNVRVNQTARVFQAEHELVRCSFTIMPKEPTRQIHLATSNESAVFQLDAKSVCDCDYC